MTAPATPLERLEQALAELGKLTPDGIADRMRALGIKGLCGNRRRCAVAEYLTRSGLIGVAVSRTVLATGALGGVVLPPTAVEFATRFDRGVYRDLVVVDGGGGPGAQL